MATLLLSSAGAAAGGAIGGSVLGVSAAALGRAAGALAGSLIDQTVLGPGARVVEGPRLDRIHVQTASEGSALPRVWGRMRIAGQVIWATRFRERASTRSSGGGKGSSGGARTTTYSYSVSFAIALCEGQVSRIGRVWADGKPFTISDVEHRLHHGSETQDPDPLITAVEGEAAAPSYRGTAYLVFEDLALEPFGNRVPQISVEVFRKPPAEPDGEPTLETMTRAVALSPGTGEFVLATTPVQRVVREGVYESENVHSFDGRADLEVALDQLQDELPNVGSVSLVVSWFGDDLRAGRCQIKPGVELASRETRPLGWRAGGVGRSAARAVSVDATGRPYFGGTPADAAVREAVRDLKARGLEVLFYPFLLMDVPPGNALPDPWTDAATQPVFPWRGRITLEHAPGRPGSPDQTAAAALEVETFFGQAAVADFSRDGDTVTYSGPPEWSFRRFILHYAHLMAAAGGVDAFAIGSELRGLTRIRSGPTDYPTVQALRSLAADVRAILGPETRLTYAADWSEYFGHQPGDGSGDVLFHLDPLWADPNIDAVGVDAYFPLADWRDDSDEAGSIHDLDYLRANIEGGEGYDWFYADDEARRLRQRTPIIDTAHGEDWVFRPKDLRNWWSSAHHDRPGGVRSPTSTGWVPASKPIWFTEIGCPAVDRGANQPNVFYDPVSSEGALPHFSRGARDDLMQRRYLEAVQSYWSGEANPVSPVYGGPMLDLGAAHLWTWDARPWPDFPLREAVWSDGPKHRMGHWLSGRLGGAPLPDAVREICARAGLTDIDVKALRGTIHGLVADRVLSGREILQPLMLAYGFDAVGTDGRVVFRHRGETAPITVDAAALVVRDDEDEPTPALELLRDEEAVVPTSARISYAQGAADYEVGGAESRLDGEARESVSVSELPLALSAEDAQSVADRWLTEARAARDSAEFALPPSLMRLSPTDVLDLTEEGESRGLFRIARAQETGVGRAIEAVRVEPQAYRPTPAEPAQPPALESPTLIAPPEVAFLDLPLLTGDEIPHAPHVGAFMAPWPQEIAVYRSDRDEGYERDLTLLRPATIGRTLAPLPPAPAGLWTARNGFRVALSDGELQSRDALAVLNGANVLALEHPSGAWEVVQFRSAELIDANQYRLAGLLRGQGGTELLSADILPAGARIVLVDDALEQISLPDNARGLDRHYRIGPAIRSYADESYRHVARAFDGVGLRPYAPAHLRAERRPDNALSVSWIRRTRIGGDLWDGGDVPLGEESERYRLRLLKDDATLLEETVVTQARVFAPGELPPTPFVVSVAQISARYGAGAERRLDILS